MSFSGVSCCVVSLNRQRQAVSQHCQQYDQQYEAQCHQPKASQPANASDKPASQKCTVVENGRVVVKLLPTVAEAAETVSQLS